MFILLGLIFSSCASLSNIKKLNSVGSEELSLLDQADFLIYQYRQENKEEHLEQAYLIIQRLQAQALVDNDFNLSLKMLEAQYLWFKNRRAQLRSILKQYDFSSEQRYYILRSFALEPSSKERSDYLIEHRTELRKEHLINLELADLALAGQDYAKASSLYDLISIEQDEKWLAVLDPRRQLALALARRENTGRLSARYIAALNKEELLTQDIIRMTMEETPYMSAEQNLASSDLWASLRRQELVSSSSDFRAKIKRGQLAYFLFRLIARQLGSISLLRADTAYSESPIADISIKAPNFSAIIHVLEWEIMELPDGLNFFPNNTLSGASYSDILQRLLRYLH